VKVLIAVVAWILAINVAYAAWLAISEFVRGRRARREVGTLDAMWQLPDVPRGARRRPSRVLAGALAVVVLGGVAIATPAGEEVVSTVGGVIGDLRGEPDDGDVAEAGDDDALVSPDAKPTREPSTSPTPSDDPRDRPRGNGGGPGEVTNDPGRDPTSSPATPPDAGVAPSVDASPSPTTSPEPSPPPPVGTFASAAEALSDTEISVTWERVPSATGYLVLRSDGGGAPVLVADLSAGKRVTVASDLSADTTYDFTITAQSSDGVLATSSASATTLPAVES
jgi:hypothetical protein